MKASLVAAGVAGLGAAVLLPASAPARAAIVGALAFSTWAALRGWRRAGLASLASAVLVGAIGTLPEASVAALAGGAALAVACWLILAALLRTEPLDRVSRAVGIVGAALALLGASALARTPAAMLLLGGPLAAPALAFALAALGVLVVVAVAIHGAVRNADKGEDA